MPLNGHTVRPATGEMWPSCQGSWGPDGTECTSLSRPDRGKSQMWGMGNRSEPSGPDETPERSLFTVLEAKNVNRSAGAGSRRAAGDGSTGRRALWLFAVAAVIAAAFVVVPFASSANPDLSGFELDGNIAHDAATSPPDDWATLFNASGQSTGAGSALA